MRTTLVVARTALVVAALLASSLTIGPATAGAAPEPVVADARGADFGESWRFALVNPSGITDPTGEFAHAQDPDYDDSAWRAVTVPHDWSIELEPDGRGRHNMRHRLPAGRPRAGTASRSRCPRRWLASGSRSSSTASTWTPTSTVNGSTSANHPYGYTGFAVDLTSRVHTDGRTPNVIAVRVPQPTAQQPLVLRQRDLPQRHGWWSPSRCTSSGTGSTSPHLTWRPLKVGLRHRPRADHAVERVGRRHGHHRRVDRAGRGRQPVVAQGSSRRSRTATDPSHRASDLTGRTTHSCGRVDTPYLYTPADTSCRAGGRPWTRTTTTFGVR